MHCINLLNEFYIKGLFIIAQRQVNLTKLVLKAGLNHLLKKHERIPVIIFCHWIGILQRILEKNHF